jgi:hypothetical protein
MLLLSPWIGFGQNRPWLPEAKLELSEQSLALANAELDSMRLLDPGR